MRFHRVFRVLGQILRPFSLLLLAPAAVDLAYGRTDGAACFAVTAAAAYALGRVLAGSEKAPSLARVEAMAVVAASWLLASMLGAVPYMQQGFSWIDALFESMSGFTTTGSTIFRSEHFFADGRDSVLSHGLLFWRAMTQWLGGMGIIVLFVAVLPALAVAGRHMFFSEAPGPEEEALTPRIRHTAVALWRVYIALTAGEALLLSTLGGMSLFEAICHSFTTLAAGGFSPHGRSLAGYGPAAQWIVIAFMFLAGASFALQYRAFSRPRALRRDTEFRAYAAITIFAGLFLALAVAGSPGHGFEASLRHGLFQSLSIVTTTGYASEDFAFWSSSALAILAALMFVGGCAGSAGGGPKVIRHVVMARFLSREILRSVHPRAFKVVRIGGRTLQDDTIRQIVSFFVAYLVIFAVVAVAVGFIEDDLTVGFTGSIATLGNIGPGLGALGPMETFGDLHPLSKLLFFLNMWIGRLEVMTILVLLHPEVLRTFSWND